MRSVAIHNVTTGEIVAQRALVAETMLTRFAGLMLRKTIPGADALVLLPTNSIHMFFMRFRIDAIFAAEDGTVVRVGRNLRPWSVGPIAPRALYCVELPAGASDSTEVGHRLQLCTPT